MIISLGLSLIAIASGALLTYTYDEDAPLASRLCSGVCIGFALMGLVGFIFASFLGLNEISIGLTELVLATPFLLFMSEQRRLAINTDATRAVQAISRATERLYCPSGIGIDRKTALLAHEKQKRRRQNQLGQADGNLIKAKKGSEDETDQAHQRETDAHTAA